MPAEPSAPTALFTSNGPKIARVDFNFTGTADTHFSYFTHNREIVCHSPANMTPEQHARLAEFAKAIDAAVIALTPRK